ncbi:MAG: maltose alpha-D-glucosyltransferase [Gammaproteobacteria bacterium]
MTETANKADWYKDAVIYQTHVKAFFDADGDGTGDFRGLAEKLDYISDLGVTAIWLLPFYPSPLKDDGYDIGHYRKVHAAYGTLADFRRFVRACHARGLRVITELVVNHTSDQHPWFQRARRAKPGTIARDFYVWSESDQKYQGTRIIFCDTERSNWTWDQEAQAYYWHRFYAHQPDLNFDNPRVFDEIVKVLHFWMRIGVDGMRLDAVPYLVEREGTTNENLPETHEILKRIRSEVDRHFPGRMLLAEANQWPEDVSDYFGNGDECHMAFHFPLMPRIYMAIAEEDRHPITDIMHQTPAIPDNCQWAIFLRNHDELTLEMVTDRERDYLWEHYAADRRSRINLGIRRRLAPLMEKDRSRIELMNALLFSMPGTPIIYYGDEIGMGDNVFLGDRDGVRTPMQWSPDRNAGFSRADPAALYLPPVMNAQYGYETVNVEEQQKSPSSLLNWMRRLITIRNGQPAFGRGSQRFLFPRNRHVLVYLREHAGTTVLCVFNLGRTAQAVELELAEFRGRIPVEMFGRTAFPPIGERDYPLTLPGYGWFWFVLATPDEAPSWHAPIPRYTPDYVTLVARRGLADLAAGAASSSLTREVLPTWLGGRRWFAGKGFAIERTSLNSFGTLANETGDLHWLAFVEVERKGRRNAPRYFLPLALAEEEAVAGTDLEPFTLARVRSGAKLRSLVDASVLPGFARALLESMAAQERIDTKLGRLHFRATPALEPADVEAGPLRLLGVEQTNTSVRLGDRVILKLYRRLDPGVNPEVEIQKFLTRAGFDRIAPLLGTLEWRDPGGRPTALAIACRYLSNQGDGWSYTLDYLARELEQAALAEANAETGGENGSRYAVYVNQIANLGRRTAELHRALASEPRIHSFAPAPVNARDRTRRVSEARATVRHACRALRRCRRRLPPSLAEQAKRLLARERRVLALFDDFSAALEGTEKIRVHGDFHLGQVLIDEGDWFILDFEGEPARTLAARRKKRSPLRDVAGMLRSFDYAAASATRAISGRAGLDSATLSAAAADWRHASENAFLEAYLASAAGVSGVPADRGRAERLIRLFMLEKAFYEVVYEAANRPDWIVIPLAGALELLHASEASPP